MEALGINPGYLVAQILNFLLILVLLRAWAYEPVLNGLRQRRERIAKSLEDARIAEEARANAERDAQARIAQSQQESQRVVADASQRAEQAASGIRTQAEAEARRIVETARAEAELERNRALGDLRDQVVALSMAAASRVIGSSMDQNRQREMINDFFARLPADVRAPGAASAEITSALPLSAEEQARAKKELGVTDATFKVDPKILGGLVVRVGDRVIDASASGQLDAMRQSLH